MGGESAYWLRPSLKRDDDWQSVRGMAGITSRRILDVSKILDCYHTAR
jgi:hypothetical protein